MKKGSKLKVLILLLAGAGAQIFAEPPAGKDWKLVFEDDFKYPNAELDKTWFSQNGASDQGRSRWRENADVKDGNLLLIAKKENRGGQEWTSGNIWTKKLFKYGYFECRYKYADHLCTNNSFWLVTQPWQKPLIKEGKAFEIDINEGWVPDIMRPNLHNWTDMKKDEKGNWTHPSKTKILRVSPKNPDIKPDVTESKYDPVKASKIRLYFGDYEPMHLRELRVWGVSENGYPNIYKKGDEANYPGLENYALNAKVEAFYRENPKFADRPPQTALDGDPETGWPAYFGYNKFIEIDLCKLQDVACVQFLTGYKEKNKYVNFTDAYKIEYFDGKKWQVFAQKTFKEAGRLDLAQEYHLYGLEWNEDWLIYYFDGKEIYKYKNEFCYTPAAIYLSLAFLGTAEITADLDGKTMSVDYVRVWQLEDGKSSVENAKPTVR